MDLLYTWPASQPAQPASQRSQRSQLLYLIINSLRGHCFGSSLVENFAPTFMRMYRESWPSGRCGLRASTAERTLTDKTQEENSKVSPQSDGHMAVPATSENLRLSRTVYVVLA